MVIYQEIICALMFGFARKKRFRNFTIVWGKRGKSAVDPSEFDMAHFSVVKFFYMLSIA